LFAADLTRALRQRGHEVRLAFLYPGPALDAFPMAAGDLRLDGDVGSRLERTMGFHPALLRRLRRALADFDPDVVQANGARSLKYGALATARSAARARLVYRNIGEPTAWIRGRATATFYRRFVIPQVDGVVGVSATTLAAVQRFHRLAVPTRRIPRAVDLAALVPARDRAAVRAELATPAEAPVLISVGSLAPEKRVDRFVAAVAAVRATFPDVVGWIAGGGPSAPAVAAAVAAAGASSFRVLGERDDVRDLLAAADLHVLTSDTEGLPGVVLEAGAVGLASVATDVGAVRECIDDARTGAVVPNGDHDALVAAITSILGSRGAPALGAAAQALVRDRFDLQAIADDYVDFYRTVVAGA
jgi:glycosyltransferase involved in cell wall biosynthesis